MKTRFQWHRHSYAHLNALWARASSSAWHAWRSCQTPCSSNPCNSKWTWSPLLRQKIKPHFFMWLYSPLFNLWLKKTVLPINRAMNLLTGGPWAPGDPFSPGWPASPFGPDTPGLPGAPLLPGGPGGPSLPGAPLEPGGPGLPYKEMFEIWIYYNKIIKNVFPLLPSFK